MIRRIGVILSAAMIVLSSLIWVEPAGALSIVISNELVGGGPPGTLTAAARLTPPPGPNVPPSGIITFNFYGPANPTCDPFGPVLSTSYASVDHFGAPAYRSAPTPVIIFPGTYRSVAFYSGDSNYQRAGPTACNNPVTSIHFDFFPRVSIFARALRPTALGETSSAIARLTRSTVPPGFPEPTGSLAFQLFGPDNPTCDPCGPVHSTSTVPVLRFGSTYYRSAPSAPITGPGIYHWVVTHSGDQWYVAVGPTPCEDRALTFAVGGTPT